MFACLFVCLFVCLFLVYDWIHLWLVFNGVWIGKIVRVLIRVWLIWDRELIMCWVRYGRLGARGQNRSPENVQGDPAVPLIVSLSLQNATRSHWLPESLAHWNINAIGLHYADWIWSVRINKKSIWTQILKKKKKMNCTNVSLAHCTCVVWLLPYIITVSIIISISSSSS